jgi:hypothetical protein
LRRYDPELKSAAQPDLIRDICRESELTPSEAHDEYLKLNGQITAHLDSFVGKIVDATEEFKNLIVPLLNQMQSMLSKRGRQRKLLNIAGVQTWEEWFEDFEKRLHLDISFRTIQRWLKRYREAEMEEPPAPDANALAKQSVRHIESKAQAEKLESVVKHRRQGRPGEPCQPHPRHRNQDQEIAGVLGEAEKRLCPASVRNGKSPALHSS